MVNRTWSGRLTLGLVALGLVMNLAASSAWADGKGQAKLDEATSLKLDANTPAKLAKVIELCEEAIADGLDDDNKSIAKQFLAASALQRAKLMVQQLPRVANNANQLRRLKTELENDVKKAIENDPAFPEAHMLAAQINMLPQADEVAALGHVNKAIELLKDSPVDQSAAYMLRARLQKDDTDAQLNDLRLATEADPTNMGAWQLRIAMQLGLGKLDEAYADIQKLLENDSSNEFAVQAAVETLLKLKKYNDLISLLDKQIENQPKEGKFYRMRATVRIVQSAEKNDKEVLKTARPDLDKAIELNSRDAQALVLRSQVLFDMGEIDQARRDIADALLINPSAIDGIFMRAAIAAREGRYPDAISDMEILVRAAPDRESYVRQLAGYYQLDGRPRLAIRLMDELIKRNKEGWRNLRQRGDALLSVGDHAEAIRDYEQALAIIDKASKKAVKKDGAEKTDPPADANAETDAEEADDSLVAAEEHAGLLNNLAWVLATSPKDDVRDGKRALELSLKSCELTEYKAAHILSTLAASYAESGDFEKAREWSTKAVELGAQEENEQLDQLKKELEGYKENKPWREEQKTEENKKPRVKGETIET
ncbi:MAG: tetratricopeptide repeat protein [Pirellulaceae bacterium]|nr:tetratricopeptide repeat protein [Pirellulaceae bacterium]